MCTAGTAHRLGLWPSLRCVQYSPRCSPDLQCGVCFLLPALSTIGRQRGSSRKWQEKFRSQHRYDTHSQYMFPCFQRKLSPVDVVVTGLFPIRPLTWVRGSGESRNNKGVVQTCVRAYVKSEYKPRVPLVVDPGGSWGTSPLSVQCGGARGEVKKRKGTGRFRPRSRLESRLRPRPRTRLFIKRTACNLMCYQGAWQFGTHIVSCPPIKLQTIKLTRPIRLRTPSTDPLMNGPLSPRNQTPGPLSPRNQTPTLSALIAVFWDHPPFRIALFQVLFYDDGCHDTPTFPTLIPIKFPIWRRPW